MIPLLELIRYATEVITKVDLNSSVLEHTHLHNNLRTDQAT